MASISHLANKKESGKKISMVTCYDYWSANLLKDAPIDCLLVGDSLAMVVHGFESTIHATLEMMALHTSSVHRAQVSVPIVADLPFLAHRKGTKILMEGVEKLMKAGANAIKVETAPGQESDIKYLTNSGIPVVGHVGLTPQYIHQLGGYKIQGKNPKAFEQIFQHSLDLQEAGCSAIVIECVPADLAAKITRSLNIPTIGIGAGVDVDGQVLVLHDLLGFNRDFKPKFVRQFAHGDRLLIDAIKEFDESVKNMSFPSEQETFR